MKVCYHCHRIFVHYLETEQEFAYRRVSCNCKPHNKKGLGRQMLNLSEFQ